MSISNRFLDYTLRVMRGDVRPGQLVNLVHSRILEKSEICSWKPTHLSIFSTDRCNFRCDMCPTHSKKIPESYVHRHCVASDMSLDLFRFVLNLYPTAIRVEIIGTGEPLFNTHFFDMVRLGVERNMIVNTISNGYEVDSYIRDIIGSGLDWICVSVNGHTAKEFNRMTGLPEAFHSKILQNVEALLRVRSNKKATPRVELSFIIDSYNYRHMADMIAVAENLGADAVVFLHFQASPYSGFTAEERCLYTDDPDVCEELRRLMSAKYRCDVVWPHLLRRLEGERNICRWPFTLLQVDGDGNVGGCPMQLLNMHENGKVYDKDPWNNQYFRDLRRRHLEKNGNLFEPCKSCVESAGVAASQVVWRKRASIA